MEDIVSVKRVKVQITVAGQAAEIDRALQSTDRWTAVADTDVIAFARELTDLVLAGLGYGHDDTPAEELRTRPNPATPSDETLFEMFRANGGLNALGAEALRAIWRAGCDAGMVAS